MTTSHDKNFGLLISFILPGFISLIGFANQSETIQTWIGQSSSDAPSVGGFLFLTVASVFAGLTVSTIRWLIIDSIHHRTGLPQPDWDFSRLASRETGFSVLIDIHYRYYQFYGNSIIALTILFVAQTVQHGWSTIATTGWLLLLGMFFIGSRDTLRKYYSRVEALLAT